MTGLGYRLLALCERCDVLQGTAGPCWCCGLDDHIVTSNRSNTHFGKESPRYQRDTPPGLDLYRKAEQ